MGFIDFLLAEAAHNKNWTAEICILICKSIKKCYMYLNNLLNWRVFRLLE